MHEDIGLEKKIVYDQGWALPGEAKAALLSCTSHLAWTPQNTILEVLVV